MTLSVKVFVSGTPVLRWIQKPSHPHPSRKEPKHSHLGTHTATTCNNHHFPCCSAVLSLSISKSDFHSAKSPTGPQTELHAAKQLSLSAKSIGMVHTEEPFLAIFVGECFCIESSLPLVVWKSRSGSPSQYVVVATHMTPRARFRKTKNCYLKFRLYEALTTTLCFNPCSALSEA